MTQISVKWLLEVNPGLEEHGQVAHYRSVPIACAHPFSTVLFRVVLTGKIDNMGLSL
jgi:hypothetical protein